MTDYRLVPVEPTAEIVSAAEDAYMPFGDMELALRMAILAAPAVQGEPVAYAVLVDNGNIRIWSADPIQAEALRLAYGDQVRPLYTAPQSAPDVAGLVDALEEIEQSAMSVLPAVYIDMSEDGDSTVEMIVRRKGSGV